ncbi:2604_t:CDS:2, partial [Ambispora leptoticha]
LSSAHKLPLVENSIELRKALHVPGTIVCGPNVNVQPKCNIGPIGVTGQECKNEWWRKVPLKSFRNVYLDAVGEEFMVNALDCFVMSPPDSLLFTPQHNEQMTISIYSNETTKLAPALNRWIFFGVYWPWMKENPLETHVDMFNVPSVSMLQFSRREIYRLDGMVEINYDAMTSRRNVNNFKNETTKWGVIHLRPDYNPQIDGYLVSVQRENPSFQYYDLFGSIGGSLTLLFLIYSFFWGQKRLDPYGVMQKYVFNTAQCDFPVPSTVLKSSNPGPRRNRVGTPLTPTETTSPIRTNTSNSTSSSILNSRPVNGTRAPLPVHVKTTRRPMTDDESDTERLVNMITMDTNCDDENDPPPPFVDQATANSASNATLMDKVKTTENEVIALKHEVRMWERVIMKYLVINSGSNLDYF